MNTWSEYRWLRRLRVSRIRAAYIAIRKAWYSRQFQKIRRARKPL